MKKKARLTSAELFAEVEKRSGVTAQIVNIVLRHYADVIFESTAAGVDVPLYCLGYFSHKDSKPKFLKGREGWGNAMAHDHWCNGFRSLTFRPSEATREKMKELVNYPHEEEA